MSNTFGLASWTSGTASTSTKILSTNTSRNYLLVQNNGTTGIYVKVDSTIATTEGIVIAAGQSWEPIIAPRGEIWVKAVSGSPAFVMIEGNNS